MTTYSLDVDECRAVVSDINAILSSKSNHFVHVDQNIVELRGTLCSDVDSEWFREVAEGLDESINTFWIEDLSPYLQTMMQDLQTCVDALEDVVNNYTNADGQMRADAEQPYQDAVSGLENDGKGN